MFDCEAQTTAPTAASARPHDEGDGERPLDVDPERRGHPLVVDAGADHHPGLGLVEPEPEPDGHCDTKSEHHQTCKRVLHPRDVEVDEAIGPTRPRQVDGVTAELLRPGRDVAREVGDDLVGDDHRDRDRDQRLAQLLAGSPTEERLLSDEAEQRDAGRSNEHRHDPLPRVDLGGRIEKPCPVIPCLHLDAM